MKTRFRKKGFALDLALKMRLKATRKWPIRVTFDDRETVYKQSQEQLIYSVHLFILGSSCCLWKHRRNSLPDDCLKRHVLHL